MILDIFLCIFLFYLSVPAVVGYFAKCYGRSFWLWFGLTCVLPIISHLVLYLLVSRDTKNNLVLTTSEEASIMKEIQQALNQSTERHW